MDGRDGAANRELKRLLGVLSILALILLVCRLPSLFFSWWYGDEKIYLAVAQRLVNGSTLYVDVWDNKPPLIYLVYALLYKGFGTRVLVFKLFNYLLTFAGAALVYELGRNAIGLSQCSAKWTAIGYAVVAGLMFEGATFNAENLFVPLVLAGLFYFHRLVLALVGERANEHLARLALLSGALWTLAGFTKVQAIIEIAALFLWGAVVVWRSPIGARKDRSMRWLSLPIAIPAAAYFLLFAGYALRGHFSDLYASILGFGGDYLKPAAPHRFLGLDLSCWLSGLEVRMLLAIAFIASALAAHRKGAIQRAGLLLSLWLTTALYLVLLSERPYFHYFLQALPPISLSIAALVKFCQRSDRALLPKLATTGSLAIVLIGCLSYFPTSPKRLWNYYRVTTYLGGFAMVEAGRLPLKEWQLQIDGGAEERTRWLLDQVEAATQPQDKIYVYATLAEVYPLSGREGAGRFVVAYHTRATLRGYPAMREQEMAQIDAAKLVIVDATQDPDGGVREHLRGTFHRTAKSGELEIWLRN